MSMSDILNLMLTIIVCIAVVANYFINKQIHKDADEMFDKATKLLKEAESLENLRRKDW